MANQMGLQFRSKVGALDESTFAVVSFKLTEVLSQPFHFHLEVAYQ